MITRPLDLASRLRPAPRTFDFWFFVNIGLIVTKEGSVTLERLGEWLKEEARTTKAPVLSVQAEEGVKHSLVTKIVELAHAAGFRVQTAVREPAKSNGGR